MFAGTLVQNREEFGTTSHQMLQAHAPNNWQTMVDDLINSNTDEESGEAIEDDTEDNCTGSA
ncbi:hypothetical protein EST38_g10828 [Candolleomyces aberdarensis]|uniref:Uncharacterized protein n=1 Tax=Candolleomyces aberdarensis TaxID=2316362 RepID=A0A4Q2D988_9AGAR|nr:hypothetical protein EST38_g10828 [Candolleomyces aberdarensis]